MTFLEEIDERINFYENLSIIKERENAALMEEKKEFFFQSILSAIEGYEAIEEKFFGIVNDFIENGYSYGCNGTNSKYLRLLNVSDKIVMIACDDEDKRKQLSAAFSKQIIRLPVNAFCFKFLFEKNCEPTSERLTMLYAESDIESIVFIPLDEVEVQLDYYKKMVIHLFDYSLQLVDHTDSLSLIKLLTEMMVHPYAKIPIPNKWGTFPCESFLEEIARHSKTTYYEKFTTVEKELLYQLKKTTKNWYRKYGFSKLDYESVLSFTFNFKSGDHYVNRFYRYAYLCTSEFIEEKKAETLTNLKKSFYDLEGGTSFNSHSPNSTYKNVKKELEKLEQLNFFE